MQFKVVVVDDSPFMRKIISDLIERDPLFKVVGTATNGLEALTLVTELKPDIVTMDVEMPEMNGLEALKIIMKDNPIPVIMLSGINENGLRETILALESGAFDFIRKPSAVVSNDIVQVGEVLLEKMKAAMEAIERRLARKAEELVRSEKKVELKKKLEPKRKLEPIKKIDMLPTNIVSRKKEVLPKVNLNAKQATRNGILDNKITDEKSANSTKQKKPTVKKTIPTKPLLGVENETSIFDQLVAIGCSTGGPRALKAVLERMPGDLPAPVVIVQHMPPKFTKSLAQRLNTFSALEVVEGEHGMVLNRGYAYIAPGGYQMKIERSSIGHYEICLTEEEPRNGHRPSVEVLFDSLLPFTMLKRHVILLTGMGSDGAQAMKRLYESGVTNTYAESEETCVVYGMPRSAVELSCVKHILPLQEIPLKLVQTLK